jgi:cation diffusion facilitator CzcD-associated flavoprotein CzcO
MANTTLDAVVIGGGPAGAVRAATLTRQGRSVCSPVAYWQPGSPRQVRARHSRRHNYMLRDVYSYPSGLTHGLFR